MATKQILRAIEMKTLRSITGRTVREKTSALISEHFVTSQHIKMAKN